MSKRNAHVTKSTLPTGPLPDNVKEQDSWYFFFGFLLLLYSLLTAVAIIERECVCGVKGGGLLGEERVEGGSCLAVACAFFFFQRTSVLNEQHMTLICTSLPTPLTPPSGFLCALQLPDTLDRTIGVTLALITLSGSEILLF